MSEPIDIVYTWVNGDDLEYRKLLAQYSTDPVDLNPERYRDDIDLLKYSIRSVCQNFHKFRNLYLITIRPQKPDWLNLNNPRLRLVHHDEYFERPETLPTFSCHTIESFFYNLPGISEKFIYMNDDFFIAQPVTTDVLFPKGKPSAFCSLVGENLKMRIYDGTWLSFGFVEHLPVPIVKQFWKEMQNVFPEEFKRTQNEKFRQKYHLHTNKLYTYYLLKYRRKETHFIPFYKTIQLGDFIKVKSEPQKELKNIKYLERSKKPFFCLNDDQGRDPNADVQKLYRRFLENLYSEKCEFEN